MKPAAICVLTALCSVLFALEPAEVAVLVNADVPGSVSVGNYYVQCRDIPQSNIIHLRLGDKNSLLISRDDYIEKVRQPVRQWLLGRPSVRCLVSAYMMPLRIAVLPDKDADKLVAALSKEKTSYQDKMGQIILKLNPNLKSDSFPCGTELAKRQIAAAIDRIKEIKEQALREEEIERFVETVMPLYGVFITSQMSEIEFGKVYRMPKDVFAVSIASREFVTKAALEGWSVEKCLETGYYSRYADVYGIVDLIDSLCQEAEKLQGINMSSAFDSELALIKLTGYDWYKWQDNTLRDNLKDENVLMVSRIDGAGEELCRGIIQKSLNAEINGVQGALCVDTRFAAANTPAEYAAYEKSLRQTANLFSSLGRETVIEETDKIYNPDKRLKTAFYCGWYSLNKYVDAFDFSEGAVGYHISSLDAADIRNPSNGQWVSSMLSKGITATIGAVEEPFLNAFPKPDEFFARLLEGYCAAEAFALTNPYNSWRIILIADPLYCPFKKR